MILMLALQPAQRENFRVRWTITDDSVPDEKDLRIQVAFLESSTEKELHRVDVSYGSGVGPTVISSLQKYKAETSSVYEAFDSHFHQDRICP